MGPASAGVCNPLEFRLAVTVAGRWQPTNFGDLAVTMNRYAADVESGEELSSGKKDRHKMRESFDAVRLCEVLTPGRWGV